MGTHGVSDRPINRKVLVSLVATMAAAATLTAIATTGQGQVEHQTGTVGASSPLESAMRRDLRLSPDQARARARDEANAIRSIASLRRSLGNAYAGAWYDAAARKVVVGVVDPAYTDVVRSVGAEPKLVKNNLAGLTGAKTRIDRMSFGAAPSSITGWYVDPPTNSVVVEARKDPAAEAFIERAKGAGSIVRVEWVTRSPQLYADIIGGNPVTFGNARCSIGFAATGPNGSQHFLTAGHCTAKAAGVVLADGQELGRVSGSTFDTDGDFGLIDVTDPNARSTASIKAAEGGPITVTGSQAAPIGASVCRAGATSGFACGEIIALDQTVNYGNGVIVRGLTRAGVCAEPGDSGGPMINGTQAQGVISGGAGGCQAGGVTFFQPIAEAIQKLGVTLITG